MTLRPLLAPALAGLVLWGCHHAAASWLHGHDLIVGLTQGEPTVALAAAVLLGSRLVLVTWPAWVVWRLWPRRAEATPP